MIGKHISKRGIMKAIIQRLLSNDKVTLGVMLVDGRPFFTTLELPWKNNQNDISCVPAGTYKCVRTFSNHFKKDVFMLQNVPGRSAVEIHVGNKVEDIRGCIAIGMQYSLAAYEIIHSGLAFDVFMKMMPTEFELTIKDVENGENKVLPERV